MKKFATAASICAVAILGAYIISSRMSANAPQQVKPNYPQYLKAVFPADSQNVFDRSQNITLYSIKADDGGYEGKNTFHGFKVLGSTKLSAELGKEIRTAFYSNAAKQGMRALCFWPHHGIRAQHEGKTVDILICFKCGHIYSYYGGKEMRNEFASEGREPFNNIYNRANLDIKDDWP